MHTQRMTALVAAAMLGTGATVLAESARFELIPGAAEANDITPDGRFVVGSLLAGGNYIWDRQADKFTPIGGIRAVAISDDGTVVLGNIVDPDGIGSQIAGIWTEATGWTSIGHLPNAGGCPSRSSAYELSADGTVAVGLGYQDGCNAFGFVWTQATGMIALEELANGTNRASVLSADGNVIAGFAQGSFSRTPAKWDGVTTNGELLDPPDGDVIGEIHGISDDGSVLLGEWLDEDVNPTDSNAVVWTETDGVRVIGNGQASSGWSGIPMDIADDDMIVGFDILSVNRSAWIAVPYPGAGGSTEWNMASVVAYMNSSGGAIPGDFDPPQVCQATSADGRVIVGHNGFPTFGAWIISRCPEDTDKDGVVAVNDLLDLLAAWGSCSQCGISPFACRADTNKDCEFDVVDLLNILSAWGDCP